MSDLKGHLEEMASSTVWHPLAATKVGNEYVLKVLDTSVGAAGITLGVTKHYNGTSNIIKSTVTFAALTKSFYIENLDTINNILISFDGGINTFILFSGKSLKLATAISSIEISSSVNGVLYQILTTE